MPLDRPVENRVSEPSESPFQSDLASIYGPIQSDKNIQHPANFESIRDRKEDSHCYQPLLPSLELHVPNGGGSKTGDPGGSGGSDASGNSDSMEAPTGPRDKVSEDGKKIPGVEKQAQDRDIKNIPY